MNMLINMANIPRRTIIRYKGDIDNKNATEEPIKAKDPPIIINFDPISMLFTPRDKLN